MPSNIFIFTYVSFYYRFIFSPRSFLLPSSSLEALLCITVVAIVTPPPYHHRRRPTRPLQVALCWWITSSPHLVPDLSPNTVNPFPLSSSPIQAVVSHLLPDSGRAITDPFSRFAVASPSLILGRAITCCLLLQIRRHKPPGFLSTSGIVVIVADGFPPCRVITASAFASPFSICMEKLNFKQCLIYI